jgi:hypothetical protein
VGTGPSAGGGTYLPSEEIEQESWADVFFEAEATVAQEMPQHKPLTDEIFQGLISSPEKSRQAPPRNQDTKAASLILSVDPSIMSAEVQRAREQASNQAASTPQASTPQASSPALGSALSSGADPLGLRKRRARRRLVLIFVVIALVLLSALAAWFAWSAPGCVIEAMTG